MRRKKKIIVSMEGKNVLTYKGKMFNIHKFFCEYIYPLTTRDYFFGGKIDAYY
jgi:hypothetical protein